MNLLADLPKLRGKIRDNVSLSKICWFGVGGTVDALFQPADIEDLSYFMANKPVDLPYFIFGVGSNVIIKDSGFRGVAIRLGREFNYIRKDNENNIISGGACLDLNVALFARDNSLQGLEFLSGIPGTIGGALAMNAGAYGKEISDVLLNAKGIEKTGKIADLTPEDCGFEYRKNKLAKDYIFIEATFKTEPGNPDEISRKIQEIQTQRASTQPIRTKTGGSTFKNPYPHKAWQLIDQAGCRGMKIGGAQVSELHCNFFINTGDASAEDLISLIEHVKEKVYKNSGILLEEEIKILGN